MREKDTNKGVKQKEQMVAPPRSRRSRYSPLFAVSLGSSSASRGAELRYIALLSLPTRLTAISGPPNKHLVVIKIY